MLLRLASVSSRLPVKGGRAGSSAIKVASSEPQKRLASVELELTGPGPGR